MSKRSSKTSPQAGISPENRDSAEVWGLTGAHQDELSLSILDALQTCAAALNPKAGEQILDLACGAGKTSRLLHDLAPDAQIVGVDFSKALIQGARKLAAAEGRPIEYQVGEAEHLPFDDAAFDAIASTFGVIFAWDLLAAARELARVCRPGGRIALTAWKPDPVSRELDTLLHGEAPSLEPQVPKDYWADPAIVRGLLEESFELEFREETSLTRAPNAEALWALWLRSSGPIRSLLSSMPSQRQKTVKRDVLAFLNQFRESEGIALPRQYWLILGTRRN